MDNLCFVLIYEQKICLNFFGSWTTILRFKMLTKFDYIVNGLKLRYQILAAMSCLTLHFFQDTDETAIHGQYVRRNRKPRNPLQKIEKKNVYNNNWLLKRNHFITIAV